MIGQDVAERWQPGGFAARAAAPGLDEIMIGAAAMLASPATSPFEADLLVISVRALGDDFEDWARGRASAGADAAGLRERLGVLLGESGRAIVDRARTDFAGRAWGSVPTAYYDLTGTEPRPISALRAGHIRSASRITTQVGLRPEGAVVERWVSGRSLGRIGGPAAARNDLADWLAGRAPRPVVAAAAIAACLELPCRPGRISSQEIEVAALARQTRRVSDAITDLRLPRATAARAAAALRSIETDAITLGRGGIETLTVDVADPIDVLIRAGSLPTRLRGPDRARR